MLGFTIVFVLRRRTIVVVVAQGARSEANFSRRDGWRSLVTRWLEVGWVVARRVDPRRVEAALHTTIGILTMKHVIFVPSASVGGIFHG